MEHHWNHDSRFLGICGGSWGTMQWLSRSIDPRFETLAEVNVRIFTGRDFASFRCKLTNIATYMAAPFDYQSNVTTVFPIGDGFDDK